MYNNYIMDNIKTNMFNSNENENDVSLQSLWNKKESPDQNEVDNIYELMFTTVNLLSEKNINYHLVAGSALGQARNSGLIPWDDDVDFGIHVKDADKIWENKQYFIERGYKITKADIGFKIGTGDINEDAITSDDSEYVVTGPKKPFSGINQDIFLFNENGYEDGIKVMRYTCERALKTWPKEVIPIHGWYNPTEGDFGGFKVNTLPPNELKWYLSNSFGNKWNTHDGNGKFINDKSCAKHTSKK